MTTSEFDAWLTKLAGVVGACASLAFLKGPWSERVIMAVGGAVVSYYAAPWMAAKTSLPEGLSGFLLGLFGMAVCARVWDTIQLLPISDVWASILDVFKRRVGGAGRDAPADQDTWRPPIRPRRDRDEP